MALHPESGEELSPMRELLAELTAALEQRRDLVYCAVVETRGSTPQKAGAAMLVFPDGGQRGTLGGGCVEAEVKQRALAVLHNAAGRAEVLRSEERRVGKECRSRGLADQ